MGDNNVTLGEIYRRLVDIDERHSDKLAEIEELQRIANTRTSKLEERTGRIEERTKSVEREVGEIKKRPTTFASLMIALLSLLVAAYVAVTR